MTTLGGDKQLEFQYQVGTPCLLGLTIYACLTGESLVEQGRREQDQAAVSAGARSRDLHCAITSIWEGCLSSLLETTEPSLRLLGTANNSSSNMERVTRAGAKGVQQALLHQPVGHVLAL